MIQTRDFFRQCEVYRASNPGAPLRVYMLFYADSIEESKYITSLDKEEKSFAKLIHEKSIMSIPEEQDGKTEIKIVPQIEVSSTRKGGAKYQQLTGGKKIYIDSREFRSALPAILHQRQLEIHPATLDVGDYLLSPEICVERKSISDLIQSFASGRLYNQIKSLCRYYKNPVLLIEFNEDQAFTLEEFIDEEISFTSLISKIVILTKHFPTLRLFWCSSPYATADLFEELKKNKSDPNLILDSNIADCEEELQDSPNDILQHLPGMNTQNCPIIMANVKNLHELSQMSAVQLGELIGKKSGQLLYEFFNRTKH